MRFVVPQFIEHEARIIGPLTFNQFVYIAIAGGTCFVLYFMLPITFFIIATVLIMLGAVAFSFIKINGRPMTVIVASVLKYSLFPKIYIWKKKDLQLINNVSINLKNKEEELPLKIAEGSQLKKLKTHIETK